MPIIWSRHVTNAPEPGVLSSGAGERPEAEARGARTFHADGDVGIGATDRSPPLCSFSPRQNGISPGIPNAFSASPTPRPTETSTRSCGPAGAAAIERRRLPGSGVLLAPRGSAGVSLCQSWLSDGAGPMALTEANASRRSSISSAWGPVMVCPCGISARGRAPISSVRADTVNASRAPSWASCRSLGLLAVRPVSGMGISVFGED